MKLRSYIISGELLHDVVDLIVPPAGFAVEVAADMPTIMADPLFLDGRRMLSFSVSRDTQVGFAIA